ncbi:MAG: type IV pilus twitching motility protein PilT [Acidobacteriota bacterium]
MATLDKILSAMEQVGAEALEMPAGEIPFFRTREGNRPVTKAPIPQANLLAYLREVAPPDTGPLLDELRPCRFLYGAHTVAVDFTASGLLVRITKAPDPGPSEAAPPAAASTDAVSAPEGAAPLDRLLYEMVSSGASDLHISSGEPPFLRVDGQMRRLGDRPILAAEEVRALLLPICPGRNREEFEASNDTDFAYEISGLARFRVNYFMDRLGMGAVFRQIPSKVPTVEELGLPKAVVDLCWLSKGLVLVTGPTGSGKSTTLAALVDFINRNRTDHLITIEDPVEFVHGNRKCLINQRQVGVHTQSFKRALRAALREDPDIVLVGELRDLETIAIALETAETGHLVFGTLHTTTAPSTIDRIIDQFPADRQAQVRVMLSESLKGVIAQTLCRRTGGGRVAALEVLLINASMANLIREGKTFQIPSIMQTQKSLGNVTLNDALLDLVKAGTVEPREAYLKSVDKPGLRALFERHKIPLAEEA